MVVKLKMAWILEQHQHGTYAAPSLNSDVPYIWCSVP